MIRGIILRIIHGTPAVIGATVGVIHIMVDTMVVTMVAAITAEDTGVIITEMDINIQIKRVEVAIHQAAGV